MKLKLFFKNLLNSIKEKYISFVNFFKISNANVRASMCLMGAGQIMYHQYTKGIIYLIIEILAIIFFALFGFQWLVGLITLGTVEADPWTGKEGDNSVIFLLLGLFSLFLLLFFIGIYISNVKDAYKSSQDVIKGIKLKTLKKNY